MHLLSALLFSAVAVLAQGPGSNITSNCQFLYTPYLGGPKFQYDLSGLTLPSPQVYYGFDQQLALYEYELNVCAPSVNCVDGATPAICQLHTGGAAYRNIGFYGRENAYWDLINSDNETEGIKFILDNGDDSCPGGLQYGATIYLDCDPSATNPQNFNLTVYSRGCHYDFHLVTAQSCPTIIPPVVPPLPQPSSGGLSGGTVFIIILLVFSFVYVAGGCIFRHVSYGVRGREACPNHEFWSGLPGLVSDGFRFCWATLTCKSSSGGMAINTSSSSSYSNIK